MRFLIIFFPALILGCFYVGRKLLLACVALLHLAPADMLPYLGAALIAVSLYPLALIIAYTLDADHPRRMLEGHSRFMDLLSWPFWMGSIALFELIPWLLLVDFLKWPFWPLYIHIKPEWNRVHYWVTLVLIAAGLVYVFVRVLLDTFLIRVSRTGFACDGLPERLAGLRIVHLSDFRLDKRTGARRLRRCINKVCKLKPDLVFFTGDLAAADKTLMHLAARELGRARARYGVFACLGDRDALVGDDAVMNSLLAYNVSVWQDRNQLVKVGRYRVLVTFFTNHTGKQQALDGLNYLMGQQPRGALDIALAHQPSEMMIELAAERSYHLFLTGHTHGGQIVLRLLGFAFAAAKVGTPFYRGVHQIQQMQVHVNNGLGVALAPCRFRAPAQVRLIEVRPGAVQRRR